MNPLLLAIEGGGTRTRMVLADAKGNPLATAQGGPSSPLYIDPPSHGRDMAALLETIQQAAEEAEGTVRLAAAAGPMDAILVRNLVDRVFAMPRWLECGEADIALALYRLDWGITLVAGTGSSCRARNEHGEAHYVGGFGPQFDDVGSAYWIGREAVTAVVHAMDGRGPQTALREALLAFYAIDNEWELIQVARAAGRLGHVPPPSVAGFARLVLDTARDGDGVAQSICHRAGRALARVIVAAADRAGFEKTPIPVVLTGGVFHGGALITGPLKQVLRGGRRFEVYPEVTEPVHGLLALAARDWAAHNSEPLAG